MIEIFFELGCRTVQAPFFRTAQPFQDEKALKIQNVILHMKGVSVKLLRVATNAITTIHCLFCWAVMYLSAPTLPFTVAFTCIFEMPPAKKSIQKIEQNGGS